MNKYRCTGKEGFQRMNYLYQVSNILATQNIAGNSSSSLYSNLLVNISRKTVQRMEIDVKRTICKSCRCLLLAGITCRIRIEKKKIVYRCLKCGNSKILDIRNKTCLPWSQGEESIVELLDFGKSREIQVVNAHKQMQKKESPAEVIHPGKIEKNKGEKEVIERQSAGEKIEPKIEPNCVK